MSATRFRLAMGRFRLALENLDEALAGPADVKAYRDSTILSFTSIYELAWNSMKLGLAEVGIDGRNPKAAFQHAYQQGWIDNERFWLDMLEDRNLVVHTYNEGLALEIYGRIRDDFAPESRRIHRFLDRQFSDLLR